jgi:hypothetical protein
MYFTIHQKRDTPTRRNVPISKKSLRLAHGTERREGTCSQLSGLCNNKERIHTSGGTAAMP